VQNSYKFYSSVSQILTFSVVFRLPPEDPIRVKQAVVEVLVLCFIELCKYCTVKEICSYGTNLALCFALVQILVHSK